MSCHALFIIMKYTEIKTIIDFIKAIKVNNYSYINYLLYGIKPNKQYSLFEIPKKNGDSRQIVSPNPNLKKIQRRIYSLLWQRYEEVMLSKTGKYQKIPSLSHGFLKNRSIITNAQKHRNRKIILNIDLKNFFDSFHFGRVRGFFLKNKYFKLPEEVATILAQLTCYNGKLPQGAPTSPLITNLICEILDYRIVKLSKKYRVTYTRYADDLTFSTNNNSFLQSVSEFIIELTNIIQKSGFEINDSKTHLSLFNQRQEVTGLIVNKKINVRREYYKKTRAMAHNLYKNGEFYIDENNNKGSINQLHGRFSFIYNIEKYNNFLSYKKSLSKNSVEYQKNLLSRNIGIKGNNDLYTKFLLQEHDINNTSYYSPKLNKLFLPKDFYSYFLKYESDYIKYLSTKEKEYQKFLFYLNFFGNTYPTLVCEGKTDPLYIKAALKNLYKDYPELVTYDNQKFTFKINFFNRTSDTNKLLFGVPEGGGSSLTFLYNYFSDIKPKNNTQEDIYTNYLEYFEKLTLHSATSPTIFLFDNEGSGQPLSNFICHVKREGKIQNNDLDDRRKEMYCQKVKKNLFVISTPKAAHDTKSDIESLLINKPIINGRTFSSQESYKREFEYGKNELANYVLKNYKTINFEKFKPLLNTIREINISYKKEYKKFNSKRE